MAHVILAQAVIYLKMGKHGGIFMGSLKKTLSMVTIDIPNIT